MHDAHIQLLGLLLNITIKNRGFILIVFIDYQKFDKVKKSLYKITLSLYYVFSILWYKLLVFYVVDIIN